MRVAIRVDAAPHIGSGHLMRCLTLADQLSARDANVHFLVRSPTAAQAALVAVSGHHLHAIPLANSSPPERNAPPHSYWLESSQAADADACGSLLTELQPDWLVVDHYALDFRWERRARGAVGGIVVIDDLADRVHDCDILLDANLHSDAEHRYAGLVPTHCRLLTGPRYALLRPEFAAARARQPRRGDQVKRVLVSVGGVDSGNLSARALQAALQAVPEGHVDVVLGSDAPHRALIADLCARDGRATLHIQTARMAELMLAADLAIGAAGSSTWERMCLGLPTLLLAVAKNQVPGLQSLCEAGLAFGHADAESLDTQTLLTMLQSLVLAPAFRRGLSLRGSELIDGHGTRRVLDAMYPLPIKLRPAQPADCADVHTWRNHPAVRAHSHDPTEIDYEDHCRWFERMLANTSTMLLVGEDATGPVGVVRFDLEDKAATVSIYLVPQRLGSGLGTPLLRAASKWLLHRHPQVQEISAEIRPGNSASTGAFAQAGYMLDHHVYVFRPGGPTP